MATPEGAEDQRCAIVLCLVVHPSDNDGIEKLLFISRTTYGCFWGRLTTIQGIFEDWSASFAASHNANLHTHAETYDKVASPMLAKSTTTQSISEATRLQIEWPTSGWVSCSSAQMLTRNKARLAAAGR